MALVELNSYTDNPLVFVKANGGGDIVSGEIFTASQPATRIKSRSPSPLSGIAERRIEQMTNPLTSMLPAFLTPDPGLNSGFMIAQVTAAALTSENRALATPHSVDSISTSGNQEDYVSMGMSGARRLEHMLHNLRYILAIELLGACQGLDLPARYKPHLGEKGHDTVRTASPRDRHRPLAPNVNVIGPRQSRRHREILHKDSSDCGGA
jgi:histidine ammonia-lyase